MTITSLVRSCLVTFLSLFFLAQLAPPVAAQPPFETVKKFVDGTDGYNPAGPMAQASDGWIYGLTIGYGLPATGSLSQCASAYRFHPGDPAGTFQTVWHSGGQGGPGCYVSDGGLVVAGDGNLYFTTIDGGFGNTTGKVFKLTPPGVVTEVGDVAVGLSPGLYGVASGLSVGNDGALYGAANRGGVLNQGGIYRVALNGAMTAVAYFPTSFSDPQGFQGRDLTPPQMGSDGRFYGAQSQRWSVSPAVMGTRTFLYRTDPVTGTTLILHQVPGGLQQPFPDGFGVRGRLVEVPPLPGNDIAFVGAMQLGGTYGGGVVFRIDVAGDAATYTKLHEFNVGGPYTGETPMAGLVRAADGTLYGTTYGYGLGGPGVGPSGEFGTVFRIGTDGIVAKLHGGSIQPFAPLLIGLDGHLYGSAFRGSDGPPPSSMLGSIFRLLFETCDGADNDLDGTTDEGFTNTDGDSQADCVDLDDDNDGVSDADETAAGSNPLNAASTPEVCDGVDNDLDGSIDEGFADADGDGQSNCVDPDDDGDGDPDSTDCQATNAAVHHGAAEIAGNSVDDNCNGQVDESAGPATGFVGLLDPYAPPPDAFRAGRVIPLSWRYESDGQVVDSALAAPNVSVWGPVACGDTTGGSTIEVSSSGNSGYQYDPITQTWQFHWKTSGLAAGCYYIQITSPVAPASPVFPIRLR